MIYEHSSSLNVLPDEYFAGHTIQTHSFSCFHLILLTCSKAKCKTGDVKYENHVTYKNLYPVFTKQLQNAWN